MAVEISLQTRIKTQVTMSNEIEMWHSPVNIYLKGFRSNNLSPMGLRNGYEVGAYLFKSNNGQVNAESHVA